MNTDAKYTYIYVLDYSDATVCKIILTQKEYEDNVDDIESLLLSKGINTNTASWMITENDIQNFILL